MNWQEYRIEKKRDSDCYPKRTEKMFGGGYKVTSWYRRCRFLRDKNGVWKIIHGLARFWYNHLCVKYGCDIPSNANIGSGLKLVHLNGIVINSKSIIGQYCTIKSGTVIGANHTGVPQIGDHVSIGVHCLVIGGISIGNNAEIGAGAIVTHDVPENGVVYGEASPVRRIKREIDKQVEIEYEDFNRN